MNVTAAQLFAASEATWPEARRWQVGPFTLRDGQGGGQRVSAATVDGAFKDNDLTAAEVGMHAAGQRPLFQVRSDTPALGAALEARGYATKDATLLYVLPIDHLTDKPIPRVTAFTIWEPLAIMKEIWATDSMSQARLDVMGRVTTKTGILARWNEKPGGAAFVGAHKNIAMVHGLVVLPEQRRQGIAEWMMRRAAFWGQAQGATHIAVLCVEANKGANALYRSLGFEIVGGYHYRQSPDRRRPQMADDMPTALDLPMVDPLPAGTQKYFDVCQDKLGMIPNVLRAHAFDIDKLNAFTALYNDLMLGDSKLTKLEREMIAVVVSSVNKCYYCLVAHGAAVRALSGDPMLGEQLVMNYRVAKLDNRQRTMLDFAHKLTAASATIEEADRQNLRDHGFSDRDIWDIANVTGFFNMTNRVASGTDMRPNDEYHTQTR